MFLILLMSAGTLLCSLLSYAAATAVVVRTAVRLLPADRGDFGFWKTVVGIMVVTLITGAMHLIEISLWAIVYLLCGVMASFETAFYFSAENYTALGYGDLVLSGRWRILGPLEAVNGLLLIGLSTAGLFVVLNRMIADRLWREASVRGPGPQPKDQGHARRN
jgi:hypothetical protein